MMALALGIVGVAFAAAVAWTVWAARDVARARLIEQRDARLATAVDDERVEALKTRMAELESNAERWNTAAREVSALSGRRKS